VTRGTGRDLLCHRGVQYVRTVVEQGWGCRLQEFDAWNDRGIDAHVHDFRNGMPTPYTCYLQIRTQQAFDPGTEFSPPISTKHRLYWANLRYAIFLVCVEAQPGEEPKAYWRLITAADASTGGIRVSRRNIFGPASRGHILAALRSTLPIRQPPAKGTLLGCPLGEGLRDFARRWYQEHLMGSGIEMPYFGRIRFTWQGWRHITRRARTRSRIHSSLLLLPSVGAALQAPLLPTDARSLEPVVRSGCNCFRTLLAFERAVKFPNRSPAKVRVVVKQTDILPNGWQFHVTDAPGRTHELSFYSVEELT